MDVCKNLFKYDDAFDINPSFLELVSYKSCLYLIGVLNFHCKVNPADGKLIFESMSEPSKDFGISTTEELMDVDVVVAVVEEVDVVDEIVCVDDVIGTDVEEVGVISLLKLILIDVLSV